MTSEVRNHGREPLQLEAVGEGKLRPAIIDDLGDTLPPWDPEDDGEALEAIAWKPETTSDAEWLVGLVMQAREEQARIRTQADLLIKRAQSREQSLLMRYGADIEHLARVALQEQNAGRKTALKSWTSLQGTVRWRKTGGGLEIEDAPAAMSWAFANGAEEAVRAEIKTLGHHAREVAAWAQERGLPVEISLLKTPLKDRMKATGELPDGCVIAPTREEMTISGQKE